MRRLLKSVCAILVFALLATQSAQAQNGGRNGGRIQPQRPCAPDCDPQPHGRIISNTFVPTVATPETGPYSYTVVVQNVGGANGSFYLECRTLANQLPCVSTDPSDFTLAAGATQEVTVSYHTLGLGHFSHRVRLWVNDLTREDSVTNGPVTVTGAAIQTHLSPLEGQLVGSSDSIKVLFAHPSGVVQSSFRMLIDGTDVTSSATITPTTMFRMGTGIAPGNRVLTTYGCATNGRCDSVLTTFVSVNLPSSWSLDDSVPAADGELLSGILPGGLPLPPIDLRGCPTEVGGPDILLNAPFTYTYQPPNATTPGGDIFMAGVMWDTQISITSTTVDNDPSNGRTCNTISFLDWDQYDWGYWMYTNPDDPLWDSYPYGDRQGLGPQGRVASTTSGHQPNDGNLRTVQSLGSLSIVRGPGGVSPMAGEAGAIDTASYWVTLNGTYIVQGGHVVPGMGATRQSMAALGSTFTISSSNPLLHHYNVSNPTSDNGGWNEIIAGISDTSDNETRIRARFVLYSAGVIADIPITPMRDFSHQDQGDCAAFGVFQCGSATLVQTIPGFVTRDRDRSLHLVYRSASQRAPTVLPYTIRVGRLNLAPDSVRAVALIGAVRQADSTHYLGTACPTAQAPVCGSDYLLQENVDATRVVATSLAAPASGDAALDSVTFSLGAFYAGQLRWNNVTQYVTRLYWTDTATTRFGAGWQLAELSRLIFLTPPNGTPAAILASGDGSYTVYRQVGGQWVAPPGERSRLVAQNDGDTSAYAIELDNGTAIGFTSAGLQRYSRDVVGNKTYYSYVGTRLRYVTDPTGFRYEFTIGSSPGRFSEVGVRSPGGLYTKLATLGYDGSGRLSYVRAWKDATNYEQTSFTYWSAPHPGAYVASITNPRGTVDSLYYDSRYYTTVVHRRPPIGTSAAGREQFRDVSRRAAPRDGRGRWSQGEVAERLLTPSQARGTFVPFAGPPTDYRTGLFDAPTYVRHFAPTGSGMVFYPDDLRDIERDSTGRVTKIVAGRHYYATNTDSVMYQYDAQGNLQYLIRTTWQYPGHIFAFDTTAFTYDSVTSGLRFQHQRCVRLRSTLDPMGGITSITYGTGQVGSCLPTNVVGLANDTTIFSYGTLTVGDRATARPVSVRPPTTVIQTATYDVTSWNTATSVRSADGATSRMFYDGLGRPDSMVDPVGVPTVTHRDNWGRVLLARTGTGVLAPVSATFYGLVGLVDSVRVYGINGDITTPAPTARQTTGYRYNTLGWLDTTITPGGRRVTYVRDALGNPYLEFTGNGSYLARSLDAWGRVMGLFDGPVGTLYSADGQPFADFPTRTLYNSYNLQPGVTSSNGTRHLYAYDERGRITSMNDSMTITQRTFRPGGQLLYETTTLEGGGLVTRTYTYNRRGQRTSVIDTVRGNGYVIGAGRIDYTWDNTTARLTSATGTRSSTMYASVTWQYDRAGRDSVRTINLNSANTLVTNWRYDGAGRLASLTTTSPQGTWYQWDQPSYNLGDQLLGARTFAPPMGGQPSTGVWGSLWYRYGSNGTGRLDSSSTATTTSTTYAWLYDVYGNQLRQTCTGNGPCESPKDTMTYGSDNRLLTRIGTHRSRVYWTDQIGSRLARTDSVDHTAQLGPQELMSYTARGQLFYAMTPTTQLSTYDHNWHWYDGNGLRVVSHVTQGGTWNSQYPAQPAEGNRTYYVYDGSDVAISVVRNGSSWWVHQRFLTGGVDQPLAGYFMTNSGTPTGPLALIADYQGSIRQAMGPAGLSEPSASYFPHNPFGALEGASGSGSTTNTQTGFTGASTPNQTGGFTYLRNRWYDPATGRFLTQDPIGLAGGVNLYAYAGNDPVQFSDPFGLCPQCWAILVAGGVGAFVGGSVQAFSNIANGREPMEGVGTAMVVGGLTAGAATAYLATGGAVGSAGTRTDTPGTGTRYMGSEEARTVAATNRIPATNAAGRPRPVHFTEDAPVPSAGAAKARYHLDTTPTHMCQFPLCNVQDRVAPTGTVAADATQAATSQPINGAGRPIPLDP